jgi:hypothetical protein
MFLALLIIFGSLLTVAEIGTLIFLKSGDVILSFFGTGISALVVFSLSSLYFKNKPVISKKIQLVCEIVFAIAVINILAFAITTFLIGRGDFPRGKVVDGHYYVSGLFGYIEVPLIFYFFNQIHSYSVFYITTPLAVLTSWISFMTGGYGRTGQLLNLLKTFSQKKNKATYKNELPKSKH